MIVVVTIVLVAWIILVFMPMLILSGGVGHLPGTGVARQTARRVAPRQEQRAWSTKQGHQLRLSGTREHPPRQLPESQQPTDPKPGTSTISVDHRTWPEAHFPRVPNRRLRAAGCYPGGVRVRLHITEFLRLGRHVVRP
jgi:hypothetical protein